MSWVKLDDSFHRNDKQLQMSDGAFRVYVCAMSWCAQATEPTGYLTTAQARALVASLGKKPAVIAELVKLNAWEEAEGGYLIHDYEKYLEKGSVERVRRFRERMRAGNVTGNGSVTPQPVTNSVTETARVTEEGVTVTPLARDGYPVPKPDVSSRLRLSETPGPVTPPTVPPEGDIANGHADAGLGEFLDALATSTARRRGTPTGRVRSLYLDRLRDGWTQADIVAAARGAALSKHHMGLNDLQVPLNDAAHVLGSKMFDALVGLGLGEIGVTRVETPEERRDREWSAALERRAAARPELQA